MGRGIHSLVHIWSHLRKYLLCANTMAFAKGVSFMTSRVEMLTWKSSILFEVPLHLSSEQQWWQAPLFDHSSCSIHQAKHILKPAHWLPYYLHKKNHQFPHLETESERGLILCPQQHKQQVKWYHNKYQDRAGTSIQICFILESFILTHILTASKALNGSWSSCIFQVQQSQSRERVSERHQEARLRRKPRPHGRLFSPHPSRTLVSVFHVFLLCVLASAVLLQQLPGLFLCLKFCPINSSSVLSYSDQFNMQIWPCHPHMEHMSIAFQIQCPIYGMRFSPTLLLLNSCFPLESLLAQKHIYFSIYVNLLYSSFPLHVWFLAPWMLKYLSIFNTPSTHLYLSISCVRLNIHIFVVFSPSKLDYFGPCLFEFEPSVPRQRLHNKWLLTEVKQLTIKWTD